ncbi:MAG: DUF4397 domain-containing protein [Chitinophagaceae bacterium]
MKKVFFVLSAAILFGISSCSLNNNNPTPPPASAFLIAQASPDAVPLDVYINNSSPFLSSFPYGNYTIYQSAAPGSYRMIFAATGTGVPIVDTTFTFQTNTAYSVFTIDSASKMKATLVVDSLVTPGTDTAKIRFLDFSPNAPAVNVAIVTPSGVDSHSRTFNDQNLIAAYTYFIPVKAGTCNITVSLAGTSTVIVPATNFTLTGGKIYTFYLKGFWGGTGVQSLSIGSINNL